ncbi:MAG: DUF4390 domain-containing protein [Burkholderiales bacterium]
MPSVPIPASPYPRPASALRRLALALLWALVWTLGGLPAPAAADTINVRSAELRIEEGEVLLNAEFDLTLNATLEEALQRGIPLYFVLEFELSRARWYWLDEKVSQTAVTYRVSYNALTRQYRVALGSGLLAPTFNTLEEVERYVGRVTSRPVAAASALAKGTKYDAALRLRLDVNQLPKPFQVSALASREWTLSSEWYRWSFVP